MLLENTLLFAGAFSSQAEAEQTARTNGVLSVRPFFPPFALFLPVRLSSALTQRCLSPQGHSETISPAKISNTRSKRYNLIWLRFSEPLLDRETWIVDSAEALELLSGSPWIGVLDNDVSGRVAVILYGWMRNCVTVQDQPFECCCLASCWGYAKGAVAWHGSMGPEILWRPQSSSRSGMQSQHLSKFANSALNWSPDDGHDIPLD